MWLKNFASYESFFKKRFQSITKTIEDSEKEKKRFEAAAAEAKRPKGQKASSTFVHGLVRVHEAE